MTLEARVIQHLKSKKMILCTVESCTGGLIAHRLTNISGASEVFWGSWVVYDNSAKLRLGVSLQTLKTKGAVSPEVADELARHGLISLNQALDQFPSSSLLKSNRWIALSTTGIAGPSGGTPEKPVGLCFSSITSIEQRPKTLKILAPPQLDRSQMKNFFAERALEALLEYDPK